jgi:hypothetical protein
MTPAKNPAAVTLGKLGGRAKSPAKTAAARENGKKGGRPPLHYLVVCTAAPEGGYKGGRVLSQCGSREGAETVAAEQRARGRTVHIEVWDRAHNRLA